MLYISDYFRRYQDEYYDRLEAIHSLGDWEGWLKFFLRGVRDVSREATETARRIISLREEHRQLVTQQGRAQNNGLALLDYLYQMPVVTNGIVRDLFNVTPVTANNLTHRFRDLGILEEITNRPRNQVFLYRTYMDMLRRSTAV